jgi:hypothetical protein
MVIARLQLGGARRAVSKLAAESAAPAPCRQLEVKPVRARRSAAQPGHATLAEQIFVQAGNASLPAAVSSASSETSDGMSSASAWQTDSSFMARNPIICAASPSL